MFTHLWEVWRCKNGTKVYKINKNMSSIQSRVVDKTNFYSRLISSVMFVKIQKCIKMIICYRGVTSPCGIYENRDLWDYKISNGLI